MTGEIMARVQLAAAGAGGGALVWAVIKAVERDWIADYPSLVLLALVLTACGALLAMAGPIGLRRALPRAAGLAALVAGLIALTALRYARADDFLNSPMPALAALAVASLPVPFLIAAAKGDWQDYPALFLEAWSIVMRFSAAGVFTGAVWLVIFLSDAVLGIVGLDVISQLMRHDLVLAVTTGAVMGLGMAVVQDYADLLSPFVVLRMVRLFVPVVLGVMLVFLVALPFRGLDGLASGLSPALLLLTMVAGGVALVSISVDQSDAEAAATPLLVRATQGLALVLPLMAGLALWAILVRVGDYGWTPERVFVTLVAGVGLAYGLVYAVTVLRGADWRARIRRGNVLLALAGILLAALWLTPILNAERISAASQLARLEAGLTPVEDLDIRALRSWGRPGAAALAALEAKAKEPGQEGLARVLAGDAEPVAPQPADLAARLADMLPVSPAQAAGTRSMLLGAAQVYQLEDWLRVCEMKLTDGSPGCLMLVADLLPLLPGEEAMLFLQRSSDYVEVSGLYIDAQGLVQTRAVVRPDGQVLTTADAMALMARYRSEPPAVTAALVNQIGTGAAGLVILP